MTAIAYLISENINKEAAVNSVITLISLGLSFTSGIFVTEELLSPNVIRISSLFPAYWYVQANEAISNNLNNMILIRYFGVMLAITMGIIGLNIILKKRKFV